MTDKEKRFVEEYLVDLNASAAAKRAGYACKNEKGGNVPTCFYKNPEVRAAIEQELARRQAQTRELQEKVLEELRAICFADAAEIHAPDGLRVIPVGSTKAVAQLSFKDGESGNSFSVRLMPKYRYLELLGRQLGMFRQKQEQTTPVVIVEGRLTDG